MRKLHKSVFFNVKLSKKSKSIWDVFILKTKQRRQKDGEALVQCGLDGFCFLSLNFGGKWTKLAETRSPGTPTFRMYDHVIVSSRHHVISSWHHVKLTSWHHVIMSSCHHVITPSRHHVIPSSCHMSSCHIITSSRQLFTIFWQLLPSFGNCLEFFTTFGVFWHLKQLLPTIGISLGSQTFGNICHLLATFAIFWQVLPSFGYFGN